MQHFTTPESQHSNPLFKAINIPADNTELCQEITRLAGHINAAEHRFLTLLAALLEREAWYQGSFKTPAHWLNYYCGIDLGAAREKVRVARCLGELPLINAAFASGTISYSKVRAMTRSATPENEAFLLDIARHGTAEHVEKLVGKFQRVKHLIDAAQDKNQYEARQLTWRYDEDGMMVIQALLTPEDGAFFVKAMDALFQVLDRKNDQASSAPLNEPDNNVSAETPTIDSITNPGHVSAETSAPEVPESTFAQKRADALMLMAEQALTTLNDGLKPMAAPDKFQVVVHLEPGHAGNGSAETSSMGHHCSLESGPARTPVSAVTAKRLACDAARITVSKDADGGILNIGRKTRTVPPAIRRALALRDACCQFPGCTQTRFLDAHHIQHWCDGGETSLDNLTLLCRHHHRVLHQEGYGITRDKTGRAVFVTPGGRNMPRALPRQFPDMGNRGDVSQQECALEAQHKHLGLDIDSTTAVTLWEGETMDYGIAIEALMNMDETCGYSQEKGVDTVEH